MTVACGGCRASDQPSARNIVLVCLDTVRFDTFHAPEREGWTDELTPWLERALVMERALSTAPWTVPAVASAFTAEYPATHGAGRFPEPVANLADDRPSGLASASPTLAELLKPRGFATTAFVAHPWFRAGYGLDRGFDTLAVRPDDAAVAAAFRWLDRHGRGDDDPRSAAAPFFLYVHLMRAHGSYQIGLRRAREFLDALDAPTRDRLRATAPRGLCDEEDRSLCTWYLLYAARVFEQRVALAGFLQGLSDRGLLADTIVVVYSDHGEEFEDHREQARALGADPRGTFGIGHGQSLFQELLHVPLLAWRPGDEGRRSSRPVSLVDIVPTLLHWVDPAGSTRYGAGVSLDDAGSEAADSNRTLFASSIAYGSEQVAAVSGWDKLVYHLSSGEATAFDLQDDPGEDRPGPAGDLPGLAEDLSKYARARAASPGGQPGALPPDVLEQLRSLGYLTGGRAPNTP